MQTLAAGDASKLHPDFSRVRAEHVEALRTLKKGKGAHLITGPVFVEDAEPGDMLQVDILSIDLNDDWGRVSIVPPLGALPNEFADACTIHADIDRETNVCMLPWGVEVPLSPFFGSIATAPPTAWV